MARHKKRSSPRRKSAKRASGKKVSVRRQARANNECCPIIRVKCHTKKVWVKEGEGRKAQVDRKVCAVSLGRRPASKNLNTEAAGKKVAGYVHALKAKRCVPLVQRAG